MITSQLIDEIRISKDKIIRLIKGDITEQNVDVVVNPANSYLKHGGGVAGHTVGPKMGEGNEDFKLSKAIHSCLLLASDNSYKSISIPAISSGIFGFPKDRCANILLDESIKFLQNNNTSIKIIEFCIIDDETLFHFKMKFKKLKKEFFSPSNNF